MQKIIQIIIAILEKLPLWNLILFESYPDFSDNAKPVFDEMLARDWNKKYKLMWVVDQSPSNFSDVRIKNVYFINRHSGLYKHFISRIAKIMIVCNQFLYCRRRDQHYFYLSHGCAVKNLKSFYCMPDDCADADFLTMSSFLAKGDAENMHFPPQQMTVTGFARNDVLFSPSLKIADYFKNGQYDKVILWLPTYRQHASSSIVHSSISMPVLHDETICKKINAYAEEKRVLLIIKPHPAQDISKIKMLQLTNLQFIEDSFLTQNKVSIYDLLSSADALLTDYSSVYFDFLLTDKPIGLCWEDFDEYKRLEGFAVDTDRLMAGGEKIYSADDLQTFIQHIAEGEDILNQERNAIRDLVHDFKDNQSAKRTVDFIEKSCLN